MSSCNSGACQASKYWTLWFVEPDCFKWILILPTERRGKGQNCEWIIISKCLLDIYLPLDILWHKEFKMLQPKIIIYTSITCKKGLAPDFPISIHIPLKSSRASLTSHWSPQGHPWQFLNPLKMHPIICQHFLITIILFNLFLISSPFLFSWTSPYSGLWCPPIEQPLYWPPSSNFLSL